MQRVSGAGNVLRLSSAGKHATVVKSGKTCNGCQVQEKIQPVPCAGKHATSAKLIDSKQQHVGSDWLEHLVRNFEPITKTKQKEIQTPLE